MEQVTRCWKCGYKLLVSGLAKTKGICPMDKSTVLISGILTGIDPALINVGETYQQAVNRLTAGA